MMKGQLEILHYLSQQNFALFESETVCHPAKKERTIGLKQIRFEKSSL